jgi:hypothetical protein
MPLASSSPGPKVARAKFEAFVRDVLAVPKSELDARLAEEKRTRSDRAKHPPA